MPRLAVRKSRYRNEPDASGWFDPALEYYFDEEAAAIGVDFFPTYLTHGEGEHAGKPFVLERWQCDRIVRPLFGWMRADGTRKYNAAWVAVPRKNGKSPLAAGIALKLTFADFEPGASRRASCSRTRSACGRGTTSSAAARSRFVTRSPCRRSTPFTRRSRLTRGQSTASTRTAS
jgi:hypothetical protein